MSYLFKIHGSEGVEHHHSPFRSGRKAARVRPRGTRRKPRAQPTTGAFPTCRAAQPSHPSTAATQPTTTPTPQHASIYFPPPTPASSLSPPLSLALAAITMEHHRHRGAVVLVVAAAAMAMAMSAVRGDFAADRAECADKLMALSTCLTFVQDGASGGAAAPTPDCCSGLKAVLAASRKCLCVLIKDRDDPNLDLKINVTKALSLPQLCNAPANISDCPSTHIFFNFSLPISSCSQF